MRGLCRGGSKGKRAEEAARAKAIFEAMSEMAREEGVSGTLAAEACGPLALSPDSPAADS